MYWTKSGAVALTAWVLNTEKVRGRTYNFMSYLALEKKV